MRTPEAQRLDSRELDFLFLFLEDVSPPSKKLPQFNKKVVKLELKKPSG